MSRRIRFERHCGFWPLPKQVELFGSVRDSVEPLPRGPDPIPTDSPEWFDLVQGKQGAGVPRTPVEAGGRALRRVCPLCGLRYIGNAPTCWAHPLTPKPSPGGQGTPPSEPDPLVRPSFAWPHRGEPIE